MLSEKLSELNEKLSGYRTIIAAWVGVAVLAIACALQLDLSAIGVEGAVTWAAVLKAIWAAVVVTFGRVGIANAGASRAAGVLLVGLLLLPACVSAESRAAAWAISQDLPTFVDYSQPSVKWLEQAKASGMNDRQAAAAWEQLAVLLESNARRLAGEFGEPDEEE